MFQLWKTRSFLVVFLFYQCLPGCRAFSDIDLLKYAETQDRNASFEGSWYDSGATSGGHNASDEDISTEEELSFTNISEFRVRNHSIIDVEYNQTDISTIISAGGIAMTSINDMTSEKYVVFTSPPPSHDFLPIGESKKYTCLAEENSKVINTHWIIPMSVTTYSVVQNSRPDLIGYISMNASDMEIFNMQADFAGTYVCVGYGENGTISRQMELNTTKVSKISFSLRITIGLSAFGSVISLLLLTVVFCKLKHVLVTKLNRSRVKPNSKKTVHFKVDSINSVPARAAQRKSDSKGTPLLEKMSENNTENACIFEKKTDGGFAIMPSLETKSGTKTELNTCIPILMVNGTNADSDFNSHGTKIESPKIERSAPKFPGRVPSNNSKDEEKETRL